MTGLDGLTITEENQRRKDHIHWIIFQIDHIHWIIFPAQDGDGTLDFEEFVKIMM